MKEQSVPYRILRTNLALTGQAASYLAEIAGITISQWRVMLFVGSGEHTSSSEIARSSAFDPAVISRSIRALEDKGLLASERLTGDRRVRELRLTEKGREVYERTRPLMVEWQKALVDVLSESEREILLHALEKLENAARKRRPPG